MKLTREEIRIVLFLLAMLVVGAAVKHYRQSQATAAQPNSAASRP